MPGKSPSASASPRRALAGVCAAWLAAAACCVWLGATVAGVRASGVPGAAAVDDAWRALLAAMTLACAASVVLALRVGAAHRRALATSESAGARAAAYRDVFEGTRAVLLVVDPATGEIADANDAAAEFYGRPRDALRGTRFHDLSAGPPDATAAHLAAAEVRCTCFQMDHRSAGGGVRTVDVYSGPFESRGRRLLFHIVHDVTERRSLEERLREARKMEALVRMAGGVARDMDDLLTIVLGHVHAARDAAGSDADVLAPLDGIERSVERGARMTSLLLALGGGRAPAGSLADAGRAVWEACAALGPLLGREVTLDVSTPDVTLPVAADAAHLRDAVSELVQNAADANGGRGAVRVAVRRADGTGDGDAPPGAPAKGPAGDPARGLWAAVTVEDEGPGISDDVRPHLFEPFFSTKPPDAEGRGRGLGLARAWGVARLCGGAVTYDSPPGRGASFTLWLPLAAQAAPAATPGAARAAPPPRRRVLLAEDDPQLRTLFAGVLLESGWDVVAAADGAEGAALWREHGGAFDALVTDIVLPRAGGARLAEQLLAERPGLAVVFVTGWADEEPPPAARRSRSCAVLRKPFRPSRIAELLGGLVPEPPAAASPAAPASREHEDPPGGRPD